MIYGAHDKKSRLDGQITIMHKFGDCSFGPRLGLAYACKTSSGSPPLSRPDTRLDSLGVLQCICTLPLLGGNASLAASCGNRYWHMQFWICVHIEHPSLSLGCSHSLPASGQPSSTNSNPHHLSPSLLSFFPYLSLLSIYKVVPHRTARSPESKMNTASPTKETVNVETMEQPESWISGTAEDQYDMTRIGKKQELRVRHASESHVIHYIQLNGSSEISNSSLSWPLLW